MSRGGAGGATWGRIVYAGSAGKSLSEKAEERCGRDATLPSLGMLNVRSGAGELRELSRGGEGERRLVQEAFYRLCVTDI